MAEYVVLVSEPKCGLAYAALSPIASREEMTAHIKEQMWPKVIEVPPPAQLRNVYDKPGTGLDRKQHPEEWMIENVLPEYPYSICTLYKSYTSYEPATHKKRGE